MHREWMRTKMPVIVTFNVGGDDSWIRGEIRGEAHPPERIQRVVIQGTDEADRVVARMANLKVKRGKPFGGAMSELWRGWTCE